MADKQELEEIRLLIANAPLNCTGGGDYSLCRPVVEGDIELAKGILAKLKDLGYEQAWTKCPDCKGDKRILKKNDEYDSFGLECDDLIVCPTCKGTGKKRKLVEWNREKVAEFLYNENEPTLIYDGVTYEKCKEIYPDKTDSYLNQADQLKEILTGE